MEAKTTSTKVRERIRQYYIRAVYSYLIPLGFVVLYILDSATFRLTNEFFLLLLLLSLLPVGIVGVVFTIIGLRFAFRSGDYEKKDIGYANLIMGIVLTAGGVLGLGLAYMMTAN